MTKKERLLKQYSEWLQMRNYSLTTYKAYMGSIRAFWRYCDSKKADRTFEKESAVQSYLAYRLQVQKRDYSTVNGDYSASHQLAVHSFEGLPDLHPAESFAHNGFTSTY